MFGIDTKILFCSHGFNGIEDDRFLLCFLQSRKIIKELECHANSSF